jgi:hypothetical protein
VSAGLAAAVSRGTDPWRAAPHQRRAVWIHGGATPTRGGGGRRRCEQGGRTRLSPSFAQHGGVDPGQRRWPRIQGREGSRGLAQHGGAGPDSFPRSVAARIWLGGFDEGSVAPQVAISSPLRGFE